MTAADYRALRETLGYPRSRWAHAFGVDHRTVLRWETPGSSAPKGFPRDMLFVVADSVGRAQRLDGIRALLDLGLTRLCRRAIQSALE